MTREHQVLLSAVGAAVRRLRDDRGLSRRELAGRSGVSERFLAELESGQGNISVARLQDVARALGSSAGELLFSAQHERNDRRIVALVGLRGAGKTTIGRALADRLRVPFVELDALVEKDAGLPLGAIFQLHGEAYYRRLAREVLTRFLAETDAAVLATGGGIVTDPGSFRLLQKRCRTVWLQAMNDRARSSWMTACLRSRMRFTLPARRSVWHRASTSSLLFDVESEPPANATANSTSSIPVGTLKLASRCA